MRLYFSTTAPQVILRTGFHVNDEDDWYHDGVALRGVTLSDRPLEPGAGVAVELPVTVIRDYEVEPDPPFRQFVVPLRTLAVHLLVPVE